MIIHFINAAKLARGVRVSMEGTYMVKLRWHGCKKFCLFNEYIKLYLSHICSLDLSGDSGDKISAILAEGRFADRGDPVHKMGYPPGGGVES
jgi:hypothetical protein